MYVIRTLVLLSSEGFLRLSNSIHGYTYICSHIHKFLGIGPVNQQETKLIRAYHLLIFGKLAVDLCDEVIRSQGHLVHGRQNRARNTDTLLQSHRLHPTLVRR